MSKTNFHTHTYRCGHAEGDENQIVEAAIDAGIEKLGFSDHVPLPDYRRFLVKGISTVILSPHGMMTMLKGLYTNGPRMRMGFPERHEHQTKVKELKKMYSHKIQIYQGYEAEYFENYLEYYQGLLETEVDYFILGHHFDQFNTTTRYYGRPDVTDSDLYQYRDDVIKALETNLFSYLAHPDLFMVGKVVFDDVAKEVTYDICQKAKELNIPLEVNAGGIRRGKREVAGEMVYQYPSKHFFEIAKEIGNDIILGIDAHSPEDLNHRIYEQMIEFCDEIGLKIVTEFEFRKGKK